MRLEYARAARAKRYAPEIAAMMDSTPASRLRTAKGHPAN